MIMDRNPELDAEVEALRDRAAKIQGISGYGLKRTTETEDEDDDEN